MIFNVPGHIEMIRNGLRRHPTVCVPQWYVKTQTRRINRGKYQVGRDYAVQSKRGVKAETDIRIVMDAIYEENCYDCFLGIAISVEDAWAEGTYPPLVFEEKFRVVYPKWDRGIRYVFKFHVVGVQK